MFLHILNTIPQEAKFYKRTYDLCYMESHII